MYMPTAYYVLLLLHLRRDSAGWSSLLLELAPVSVGVGNWSVYACIWVWYTRYKGIGVGVY